MSTLFLWLWYLLPGNPVVVRIVEGGSRRMRHLWVRMGYLGLLIGLMLTMLLLQSSVGTVVSLTDLAKAGTEVFRWVANGQVILLCLLAPLFMAGAISAEQSGKTMDILLTTPLSNMQIVLGSLAGRLFFILALLFSGLPLFAILLVFGGVPAQAIFVAFAVAAFTALTVGSVAVTLAVLRAGGRKAVFLFVVAVTCYLSLTWAVDRLARFNQVSWAVAGAASSGGTSPNVTPGSGGGRTTLLTPLHPLLVLEASLGGLNYKLPSADELANLPWITRVYLGRPLLTFASLSMLVSFILLTWSALQLRLVGEQLPLRVRLANLLNRGRGGKEHKRTARTVTGNPIAWREAHTRGSRLGNRLARGSFFAVGMLMASALLMAYHHASLPKINDPFGAGFLSQRQVFQYALSMLLMVELAIIVLVAIYMSAGCVSREREDGTLDLVLTTSITPRDYLWGKLRGLVSFLSQLLLVPILTVMLVSMYVMIGNFMQWAPVKTSYSLANNRGTVKLDLMPPEVALWVPMLLLPFVAMCVMIGMTWSIKSKGVLGAIVPSVGIIGTLTLVTGFCGYNAANSLPWLGPALNAFSPSTSLIMLVNPYDNVRDFVDNTDIGRVSLGVATIISCSVYLGIVYTLLTAMVHSFDQTVRRLSGTT